METIFVQLTDGWNAGPNAPIPTIDINDESLVLAFWLNSFQYPQFSEGDWGEITFQQCSRYRLGSTNDEGWYRGQCRFSKIAPAWGEFYEISGDLREDVQALTWHSLPGKPHPSRHFLFYFRDHTFECDASDWQLTVNRSDGSRQRAFSL